MSLTTWSIGLITYNLIIIIFLIGISSVYDSSHDYTTLDLDDYNVSAPHSYTDLNILQKFGYTLSGIPWYISILLILPNIIAAIIIIMYIRGVR